MKTTTLLIALTAFGVLSLGVAFADEPSSQTSKPESKGDGKTTGRPTVLTHGASTPGKTNLKDAPHSKNITRPAPSAPVAAKAAANPSPPNGFAPNAAGKTSAPLKNGLVADKTTSKPVAPAKPPVGAGTVPATGTSKNKIATTAAVGGAAAPGVKNSTATVNGANVKPKSRPF